MFGEPPSLRTAATPPSVPGGKKTGERISDFSSVQNITELTCHVKNVHRSVGPMGISHQKTVLSIQPYGRQVAHASVMSLSHHV